MFRFGPMHEKLSEIHTKPYLGKMQPFRVIMIDPGYASTAYLVIDSIYQLGFSPRDIQYIINTHWHGDHTEATAAFADLSGAKTLLGRDDVEKAARYFTPDILIDDGDTLTLGNTTVTFVHTPGHTKGTVSPFFETEDAGQTYRVGMFGGAGLNTLVPSKYDFEGAREAYLASLARLKKEKVDVFIGNHTWNNDTYNKSLKLLATGENTFLDGNLWVEFLNTYERRLKDLMQKD